MIDSKEHTDGRTMVKTVHIPNCPHGEARKGTMFTTNDTSVSNFIGQCFVSILFDVMQSPPSDEMQVQVFKVAQDNVTLRKRFNSVAGQVVSAREKWKRCLLFTAGLYIHTFFKVKAYGKRQ